MKALIWIIVLIVIGWGIWWATHRGDSLNNAATPVGAIDNYGNDADQASSSTEPNLDEFQDKG